MLITRLELENIKSYKHVTVNFQRGTTAISGSNGAGKTTLVEAIGFALFDSMPYKQDQFVREGEKYGRVVIHLIGNDDRPYEVERRCGAGASWTLYDREANFRLEQRADVQDKLHELFGVERERSLESLFRDALGVPQGAFTSIFLQKTSLRKATFDALLQIEDYRTAADYLLDAQKQYKEQGSEQDNEIRRLTYETRELEAWRESLKSAREQDQDLKARNVEGTQRLGEQRAYSEQLKQRQVHLQQCEAQLKHSKGQRENANQLFEHAEKALSEARAAHQAVEESRPDYERYLQAEKELARLRQDERQRNSLRQQQASLNSTILVTQATIQNIQQSLDKVAEAHQRVLELIPEVEKQSELDTQIATLTLEVQQYETLRKEGNRLYQLREKSRQEQATAKQRIAEIEPLQALADLHNERVAQLAQLQAQSAQRQAKRLQLEEKRQFLQEKQHDLAQTVAKLRKAEDTIAKIEAHRHEGEEFTLLLEQQTELDRQQHHLSGNIESYTDSRDRSAGGQCPLLHQTCLNIQQQGQLSLEAYFTDLLVEEQVQLDQIVSQRAQIEERATAIKKYAEALEKLGRFVDQSEGYAEHIERLNVEIRRQEREVEGLQAEWESLQHIDQEISRAEARRLESENADKQTRQLPGLESQVEQLQAQIEQYNTDFEERRAEAEPLQGSKGQLEVCKQTLAALNDPRGQSKIAQAVMKPEASYRQQLQDAQQALQETTRQMDELLLKLETYAHLDRALGEQEVTRERAANGYQIYSQNVKIARSLPEREAEWKTARQKAEQTAQNLTRAEEAYQQAALAFDQREFDAVEREIRDLGNEIAALAEKMQNLQKDINALEQKIANAEVLLVALEAAQKEKQTLDELITMMEQFRKVIKDAAPHVLRAMLSDISAEANRIFGEIMGDRSAQLTWADDYEISLLRQGARRAFAQLSGGEQMSAALAVRLALLKKLSTINIAFFDEPTQNMDEQRRSNLAEQIRRVRGFDQLIVISHDDTFEQGLDSLIRLRKQDGQTRQLTEDDDFSSPAFLEEQVPNLSADLANSSIQIG